MGAHAGLLLGIGQLWRAEGELISGLASKVSLVDEHSPSGSLSLMRPGVFLEVIFAAEALATTCASMRPDTCMYHSVARELFVSCEGLVTVGVVAYEGSFAGVDPDVVLELAVV